MTYSSPLKGRVQIPTTRFAASYPVDPLGAAYELGNNLLHQADQSCARVLASWMAPDAALVGKAAYVAGTAYDGAYVTMAQTGAVPLSTYIGADGVRRAYRLRCSLAGSAATGTGSTAFGILLAPPDARYWIDPASLTSGLDWCPFSATSSTTPAYLTPTPADGVIEVSASLLSQCLTSWSTMTYETSGERSASQIYAVGIRIVALGDVGPLLYGYQIEEVY